MGNRLIEQVCRLKLSPAEKVVALAYAHRSKDDDPEKGAWPSVDGLAEFTSRSRSTVLRAISSLRDQGILLDTGIRKGKTGHIVAYRIGTSNSVSVTPLDQPNSVMVTSEQCHGDTVKQCHGDTRNYKDLEQQENSEKQSSGLSSQMAVEQVWEYYIEQTGKNSTIYTLTPVRLAMGKLRFAEALKKVGGDNDKAIFLMQCAVDALRDSEFHNGKNDARQVYNDWETIFRSAEKFEHWLEVSNR